MSFRFEYDYVFKPAVGEDVLKNIVKANKLTLKWSGLGFSFIQEEGHGFFPLLGDPPLMTRGIVALQEYPLVSMIDLCKSCDEIHVCSDENIVGLESIPEVKVQVYKMYDWEKMLVTLAEKRMTKVLPSECDNPRIPIRFEWNENGKYKELFEADCLGTTMFEKMSNDIVYLYKRVTTPS